MKYIKALRVSNNLSQKQLAEILGVTPLTISKWENDSLYAPKKKTIIKAAKYFDVFERCFDVTISMRLIDKEHDMDLSDKIIEWLLKRHYDD